MQLEELTEKGHDLLKKTIASVQRPAVQETNDSKFRRSFILKHASCIFQIAEDVLDLEDNGRTFSSPVLVRGMLEDLFILGAAARRKDFIGQKIIYDLEKAAEYACMASKKTPSSDLKSFLLDQANISENSAKNLRQKHQIGGKFKWSPMDCALAADLFRQYAIGYAHYSTSTHGEFFSLILRGQRWTSTHVIRTVAFICLTASGFLISSVEIDGAVDLEKKRIELIGSLAQLERQGKMKEMHLHEMGGKPAIARGKRGARLQQN